MSFQTLTSPEVYFGAALVVLLVFVIASMVLSTRPDARMEFLIGLMKGFPLADENWSSDLESELEERTEGWLAHP